MDGYRRLPGSFRFRSCEGVWGWSPDARGSAFLHRKELAMPLRVTLGLTGAACPTGGVGASGSISVE